MAKDAATSGEAGKTARQPSSKEIAAGIQLRFLIWNRSFDIVTGIAYLIFSAVPLSVVAAMVWFVSGKKTDINVALTAVVTFTVTGAAGLVNAYTKSRKMAEQKEELVRCRTRVELLEKQLSECQSRSMRRGKE